MRVLNNAQGTEEWLKDRVGVITASRFSDVLAKIKSGEAATRANYRAEIVAERLTGIGVSSYTTSEMQWGKDHEDEARQIYEAIKGSKVAQLGLIKHDTLEAGASLDGDIQDGCIEIKCPNTSNHIATLLSGVAPLKHMAQMQGQMWLANKKWCDFISFDPRLNDKLAFFTTRVERDDAYIEVLEREVAKFDDEVNETIRKLNQL